MIAQPRKHHDREPQPADSPRRAPSPPSGDIVAGTASRVGQRSHGRRLAYFVDKAVRLTGWPRDLLYDQMRLGYLASVNVGQRYLITCQHMRQLLAIAF